VAVRSSYATDTKRLGHSPRVQGDSKTDKGVEVSISFITVEAVDNSSDSS